MTENVFLIHDSDGQLAVETDGQRYRLNGSVPSLDWLLTQTSAGEIEQLLDAARSEAIGAAEVSRFVPGMQEIWGAGVTYKRSEEARERESNQSRMYTYIYHATRPELFFKAMGYSAVSTGELVGIRHDANWSVPEPELVVVLNARLEVVGFTVGNDMSSRDIEGENPLYLPQAKIYERACALGPRLWLQPGVQVWPDIVIDMEIQRGGQPVFHGTTTTSNLNRTLPELVSHLGRCRRFPYGVLLLTGTGVIPPDDFTLAEGDEVSITMNPIGTLTNQVTVIPPQYP